MEPERNWSKELSERFENALENGDDELDVVMKLIDDGFRLEMLPENDGHYIYLKQFMQEHGLL